MYEYLCDKTAVVLKERKSVSVLALFQYQLVITVLVPVLEP